MESPSAMSSTVSTATQVPTALAPRREVRNPGVRISVVIPAQNEAHNLPYALTRLPRWVHEVILVDGHSTDGTRDVARRILPSVTVLQQTGKGKGDALHCGVAASSGEIVVMLDADGSTDPDELPRFVAALLAGADVVKGSRCLGEDCGSGSGDLTPLRRLGNQLLRGLVNGLFGLRFTDLCYGYTALWKDSFEFFDWACEGFEVEALLSLRAWKANLKIVEVPSFEQPRRYGTSHLRTFRDGWRVLRVIVRERVNGRAPIRAAGMHRCRYEASTVVDTQALVQQMAGIV